MKELYKKNYFIVCYSRNNTLSSNQHGLLFLINLLMLTWYPQSLVHTSLAPPRLHRMKGKRRNEAQ